MKTLSIALLVAALGVALPASAQWIGFNPSETVPSNEVFTVDLVLDTEGEVIMGVDALFSFDPAVVRLDSVTIGDWFSGAPQPSFFWADAATGVPGVARVIGSVVTTGRDGSGALAVLHFTVVAAGFSPLSFLAVTVRDPLNAPVPVTPSTGDRIIIEEAIDVRAAAFGEVQALYR